MITPHKRGAIYADKRQCNHRYRVAVRARLAGAVMRCEDTSGTACQRPANKNNGRCRLHGGASTGVKTEEGRARISAANLRHENFTRMYIFEYESPEAVKACLPVWKELETAIFGGIAMKLTAYRGVTVESWKRD